MMTAFAFVGQAVGSSVGQTAAAPIGPAQINPAGPPGTRGQDGAPGAPGPAGPTQDISGKLDKAGDASGTSVKLPFSGVVARALADRATDRGVTLQDIGTVGSGATDDTNVLNLAASVALSLRRPLQILAGTYLSSGWNVPAGLAVRADKDAIFTLASGSNRPLIILAAGASLDGGQFDGNAAGNPNVDYNGLIQAAGDGAVIRRVTVRNWNGLGIQSFANNVVIEENDISGTKQSAIFATDGSSATSGLVIRRNRIRHLTYTANSPADMCIQVHANTVSLDSVQVQDNACTMTANTSFPFTVMGIEILGASPSIPVSNYSIGGNVVRGGGQSISVGNTVNGTIVGNPVSSFSQYGIEVAANNINVTVSANASNGTGAAGYAIWTSANNSNVTIANNVVTGAAQGGIYSFNTQVAISNNQINQPYSASAIYCQSCRGSKANGNTITGTPDQGIQFAGGSNNQASLNTISGSTANGILFWDGGEAGPFFFSANENMLTPTSGGTVSRSFGSKTTTGSTMRNNTSPSGVIADWTSP